MSMKINLDSVTGLPHFAEKMRASVAEACGGRTPPLDTLAALIVKGATPEDVIAALNAHPRAGDGKAAAKKKFSSGEQGAVLAADEGVLATMERLNDEYEAKFGFRYVIAARGRQPAEVLVDLQARMGNSREQEVEIARGHEANIVAMRVASLLEAQNSGSRL
jgi:OHCU decarboxylase